MRVYTILFSIFFFLLASAKSTTSNMNGHYTVASGPHQQVPFNDDYASKGYEYFDVYTSEIATKYSEVFWRDMGMHPLPSQILERFFNKTIAIVGYEHDQVMVYPTGQPGVNPQLDVSVPFNWVYNHHYGLYIIGNSSTLEMRDVDPLTHHGSSRMMMPVDRPEAKLRGPNAPPNNQFFSEGNGGESRKSYHGYPKGYAQLIDFPTQWHVTPMQIDTRNRDCGVTNASIHNCTQFIPGPEPRQARYGRGYPKGTNVSGLIECPCNSRFGGDKMFYPGADDPTNPNATKVVVHKYNVAGFSQCPTFSVANVEECFQSALSLGLPNTNTKIVSGSAYPAGCSVQRSDGNNVTVVYNTNSSSTKLCAMSQKRFGSQTVDPSVGTTLSVQLDGDSTNNNGGLATITMVGPSDVWFGFGFNASRMADLPWAIIVEVGDVIEQQLGICGDEGRHCPGTLLNSSITVVSNTVAGKTRTVVVTRPFKGLSDVYYTFNVTTGATINFIAAVGSTPTLSYHRAHTQSTLSLLTTDDAPNCICDAGAAGELRGFNYSSQSFIKNCREELTEYQNPTCNTRLYAGGLTCCVDGHFLLDSDQEIPEELLRYHLKFRFWFQEYTPRDRINNTPASHRNLDRIYMQTENAAGEFDVPPAFALDGQPIVGYPNLPPGQLTPGSTCTGTCPGLDCECVHTLIYRWAWANSNMTLIYAGGHCHAPTCRSLALYRNDTGTPELLCQQLPVYGQGHVEGDRFDEAGYIHIPPCLWGAESEGLLPPPFLPAGTPLVAVAINKNDDVGHFGEMASWQMRGFCSDNSESGGEYISCSNNITEQWP